MFNVKLESGSTLNFYMQYAIHIHIPVLHYDTDQCFLYDKADRPVLCAVIEECWLLCVESLYICKSIIHDYIFVMLLLCWKVPEPVHRLKGLVYISCSKHLTPS